jgi:hypothetical protein
VGSLTAPSFSVGAAKGADVLICRIRDYGISLESFESALQEVDGPAVDAGGEQLVLIGLGCEPPVLGLGRLNELLRLRLRFGNQPLCLFFRRLEQTLGLVADRLGVRFGFGAERLARLVCVDHCLAHEELGPRLRFLEPARQSFAFRFQVSHACRSPVRSRFKRSIASN